MFRRKFGNTKVAGFDSKKEARRAQDLLLLEKLGAIADLKMQVPFELIPKQDGERAVKYVADFVYKEDGATVVEDSKGYPTPEWVIKRKLMLFRHGIKVKVT